MARKSHNVFVRLQLTAVIATAGVLAMALSAAAQTPAGTITSVAGQIAIQRGGKTVALAVGVHVDQGDRITTGRDGRVSIVLTDHSQIEVGESSVSVIDEHATVAGGGIRTRIGLLSGIVRSIVNATPGSADFAVHTPNAVSAVRGTRFDTAYHDGAARSGYGSCRQFTDVAVYEGIVGVSSVSSPSAQVEVPAGYETTVACSAAPLAPGPLGITERNGIGRFRGTSPSMAAPPPVAPSETAPPPLPPPGAGSR